MRAILRDHRPMVARAAELPRHMPRTLPLNLLQDVGREWRDGRDSGHTLHCFSWNLLEATAGIEPACADLQSAA